MKGLLFSVVLFISMSLTYSIRYARQEPIVVKSVRPATPSKIRTRVVQKECPRQGVRSSDQVASIRRETARLQREAALFLEKKSKIGEALPATMLAEYAPERVRPSLEALLPEAGEAHWVCESVPCSVVVVFSADDADAAAQFSDAADVQFPGSASQVVPIDAKGWVCEDAEKVGLSVTVTVMPPNLEGPQKQRAWYMNRYASEQLMRIRRRVAGE